MSAELFKDEVKLNRCLKIIFSVAVFIISIRHICQVYQPTLLDDEYAYWSIAAYFKGYDWSSVTSLCKYYSYGYSIILYIIMEIFGDFVYMYRAAIVVNGVLLVAGFLLLDSIFRKMFPDERRTVMVMLSFIMTMIPCNIAFSTVNLTECLLYVLFLAAVRIMLDIDESTSLWKMMVSGVLLGYSYMVHQRMICVIISVIVMFMVMLYKKKVTFRQVFVFTAFIALFMIIHHFIKADIKENLWLNGSKSADNDYGSIFENLKYVSRSLKSLVVFAIGIMGKLLYFGTATYIFGFVAVMAAAKKAYRYVWHGEEDNNRHIYVAVFSSFLLMMIISALFMCRMEKLAWLVYGRYAEFMYPLLFGIGIINVYKMARKNILKMILVFSICSSAYAAIGIIVRMYVKRRGLEWVNYISCSQIYKYADGDNLKILTMMVTVLVTAAAVTVIMSLKKYERISGILLEVLALMVFMQTAEIPLKAVNLVLQRDKYDTSSIITFMEQNGIEDRNVYYYISETEEEESAQYREYIQYWLQDKKVICVTEKELQKIDREGWLIISDEEYQEVAGKKMKSVYSNSMCSMFELKP
ncbi:MAG: hypothetical protein HDT39_00760 [Lachnospiraceae bacterium]|nr:hypothetical protein [Lachnospiraceae bacterium]